MSETIKLCAMLARAVFENDDEAREPFVEQAMRAKREHDEMRRNLAEADTTRREWEVRAATSYAAGRAAGLREAAGKHLELRPQVATFARGMERKLRANDHKGGWENESAQYLLSRLCEEVSELLELYDVDSTEPDKVGPREAFAIAVSYTRYAADALRRLKGTLPGRVRAKAGVESEAADVANFAMMIADVCGTIAPPVAETVRTETIFGCRTCPASTPGWTDGRFASPGWGRIDHIDGPNAICPVCAADPTSLDCLREEYPDVTPAAEPRDEGEVSDE